MKNHKISIEDKQFFKDNGYLVIQNFFSKEEIYNLREVSLNYFNEEKNHFIFHNCGKIVPNAFEYVKEIRGVLSKDLIDISKDLLGDIKYVFHSDLHYNMFNNWHRDLSSDYIDGFDSEETFEKATIYKIGIYLQDHSDNNQGLSLIPKSHKIFDEKEFSSPLTLNSKVGDIVIFDQRIMHKGFYINEEEKGFCKEIEKENQNIDEKKFQFFKDKRELDKTTKMSIFFGLGLDGEITKEF